MPRDPEGPYVLGAIAARAVAYALSGVDADPYLDVNDLTQLGLLHAMEQDTSVLMHVATDVRALLTPLGANFVAFVTAQALARSGETSRPPATGF